MAAYRRVYDSRHLQADCQEPGSAPEPYGRHSSMGYLYLFTWSHSEYLFKYYVWVYGVRMVWIIFVMEVSYGNLFCVTPSD